MEHWLTPEAVRKIVREELQNALDNGETLARWTVLQIAVDMVRYSQRLELAKPADLMPHIVEWQEEQLQKTS